MFRITDKRFQQINLPSDIVDIKNGKIYHTLSGNDGYDLCNLLNELYEETIMLKGEVVHYKLILMSLEEEAKRLSQIR